MPFPAVRWARMSVPGFTFHTMSTTPAQPGAPWGAGPGAPTGGSVGFGGSPSAPTQRPRGVDVWIARLTRPVWRTWLIYLPLCTMTSVLAIAAWEVRNNGGVPLSVEQAGSGPGPWLWLLSMLAVLALGWRRRWPEAIVLLTSATALVLPVDPVAALIALGSMLVRRVDRVAVSLVGLVGVVTLVTVWRDSRGTTMDTSFFQFMRTNDKTAVFEPFPWWLVLLITLAVMTIVVGLAMLLRFRSSLTRANVVVEEQQAVVDHLADEVSRQAERERLAQEVHDALGHRLSLLSLHAGALEMTAGRDPRVAESAALVRANAQQSMADLRSLLAMLRQPDAPDVAAAVPTLRDVPALIDETVGTGVTIVSVVQLDGLGRLDETTSRSAFRITQELLTNARKHAPGIGVRVEVRASPDTGVQIEVANHLPPHVPVQFDPGSGLDGIRHRVLTLGGDFRCFVDSQRVFRVAARMPWVWSAEINPSWVAGKEGET